MARLYAKGVMSDAEIVEQIKKGDEKVIDYLYRKHYRMIVNLIMKNSGSREEAEDVFQDALVVFWQKAGSGNLVLTSKISTFLYSICQNLWRKELDRKSRLSYEEKETSELADTEKAEKLTIITKCIDKLSESCRKILTLYYFEEMNMQDIADQMGFANADTAKTKKYKCKQELEKAIRKNYSYGDFFE